MLIEPTPPISSEYASSFAPVPLETLFVAVLAVEEVPPVITSPPDWNAFESVCNLLQLIYHSLYHSNNSCSCI